MSVIRVSRIGNEAEMKRVVWKSMEAREWLVCQDI